MNINKKSFTLIELMIVVIIVGVLAAVAAPMMRKSIIRSKWTEAVAMVGTIRSAERVYYTEYGTYKSFNLGEAPTAFPSLGLKAVDFDGVYFSNNCFNCAGDLNQISCAANASTAPKANEVSAGSGSLVLYMNNGTLLEQY